MSQHDDRYAPPTAAESTRARQTGSTITQLRTEQRAAERLTRNVEHAGIIAQLLVTDTWFSEKERAALRAAIRVLRGDHE